MLAVCCGDAGEDLVDSREGMGDAEPGGSGGVEASYVSPSAKHERAE
jgi:hypothetical protein